MKKYILSSLVLASLAFIGCEKEDDENDDKSGTVSLSFNHKVSDAELMFDTIMYTTAYGHDYEVQTLRYMISNITFTADNGSQTVFEGPIYVDAEREEDLTFDQNIEIPAGRYTSIAMTFGLDTALNKSNTLTSADAINFAWPEMMGGGYHFMKLEGVYDSLSTGNLKPFNTHTGATGGNANHVVYTFDNSGFTIEESNLDLVLTMDVNEWYRGAKNYNFCEYGPGIMGNQAAQEEIKANAPGVFSVTVK